MTIKPMLVGSAQTSQPGQVGRMRVCEFMGIRVGYAAHHLRRSAQPAASPIRGWT